MKFFLPSFMALFTLQLQAGSITSGIPDEINSHGKYVFYLHGAIIEKGDLRPVHPRYGLYDYPAVIEALAVDNIQLITEQREFNVNHLAYAEKLISQISTLIELGVKAQAITVIGFSKGAMITIMVSSIFKNSDVNFVLLAACGPWYDTRPELQELRLYGNVFSIYETTDIAGSCMSLASREPKPNSFKELAIYTGKEHGAFYLPNKEWLLPVLNWIKY